MDRSYSSIENSYTRLSNSTNNANNLDTSISDQLASFGRLRISALTKAVAISPLIKEVTIGPKSPLKKESIIEEKSPVKPEDINLLQDKLGDELRHALFVKKWEAKLQQTSQKMFTNLTETLIANYAETIERYCGKQCIKLQQQPQSWKHQMINQLKESDNMSVLEEAKLDEQKYQLINMQTKETFNKILEEQNLARIAQIKKYHIQIIVCYREILDIIELDQLAKHIGQKYMTFLNEVLSNMADIISLCNNGDIKDKNVQFSEELALRIINVKEIFFNELSIANNEQIRIQKENEIQNKELEEKRALQEELLKKEQQKSEEVKKAGPIFYSESNYSYYLSLKSYLANYENNYKQLLEDSTLKKFKFDCQKAVNTPINALTSVSGAHMKKTLEKLAKLLRGEKVQISDEYVSASQHPQGLYYCNALLAKKIVRQGDLLVSSKPEAAFPIAAITVALWVEFPEFGKLLEACFHRECPYLIPMFLPQKEDQTDKEFYLSRGYTYNDENVVEKQDKFLKRMSGIFRLRCAIWIANTPSFISAPNPHGLKYSWKWIASFINLRPEPDICATLLHDFFTVCGSVCYKHYGKQFTKIIKIISTQYLPILQNIDEGGPKIRLELFLQNILGNGTIPPPNGLLPLNSW